MVQMHLAVVDVGANAPLVVDVGANAPLVVVDVGAFAWLRVGVGVGVGVGMGVNKAHFMKSSEGGVTFRKFHSRISMQL